MAKFFSARRYLPLALPSGSIDHSAPTQSRGFFSILDDASARGTETAPVTSLKAKRPDDFLLFVNGWLAVECRKVTGVLVIDDHPVARHGCRRVLERIGITTIFGAGDVVAGYELFGRHRPDVVIVDLALGDNRLGGLSLIRRFSSENPKAHILVLSMHNDPHIVSRALEAGATGYVLKDTTVDDLLEAFQAVQVGNSYLSHELASQLAMARTPSQQDPLCGTHTATAPNADAFSRRQGL